MNDLKTSQLALGIIGSVSSFIYGLGSLVGGSLSDRVNEVKIIAMGLAFAGMSTLVLLFANTIFIYSLAMILMAAWASLYHPTANSLISKAFSKHMAEAMGFHGVGGTLGVMLTPVVAFVLGVTFGWQFSFLFFGSLSVVVSVLLVKSEFKSARFYSRSSIREVFKTLGLWKILVFSVVVGLYMRGVQYFLPTYLVLKPFQVLSKESAEFWAAMSATLVLASGVPGQWLGGKTADVFGSKKVLIATSIGVLAGLLFLQFTPFWFIGVPAFIVLYGLSFYGHQPALNSLAGIMTPEDRRGTVYGMLFFTSFGLGSISSAITGYLMEHSVELSFQVLTAFAATGLLLSLIIPDIREKRNKR